MALSGFSVIGFVAGAFHPDSPEKTRTLVPSETAFLSSKLYISPVINKYDKAAVLPGYFIRTGKCLGLFTDQKPSTARIAINVATDATFR